MGRQRKKAFEKLPKYVYFNRGRYVYRPRENGIIQKDILIGKSSLSIADVWRIHQEITGSTKDTLQFLVDEYRQSKEFKAKKSHKALSESLDRLLMTPVGQSNFGLIKFKDITSGSIRKYLDYRSCVSGNREITYLSSAWNWCYERDIVMIINPCKGVKKIKESPRTRYVSDSEYQAVYDISPKYVQVSMELAYLCRMRLSEVLDTRVSDIEEQGLNTRRLKGSDTTLTIWTERLLDAINNGLDGCLRVPNMSIVNNGKGDKVKSSALKSYWQRMKKNPPCEYFTFHDLKAKGVSDFDGDKQLAGGHKDPKMVAVYDRKRKEIKATE